MEGRRKEVTDVVPGAQIIVISIEHLICIKGCG